MVTGGTFEAAVRELVLDPLGLQRTFYFPFDIMVRRFVVGHERRSDGSITMYRSVLESRSGNPAGANVSATAADQIRWARFHLGNGAAPNGTRILSEELLRRMKRSTAECPGSAIGDAVGISWLLRDVDGTPLVMHGGTTLGQHSEFVMAPEHDFAFVSMTNCGPNGAELNDRLRRWALETFLGVTDVDPVPQPRPEDELRPFLGTYETIAETYRVDAANGGLVVNSQLKPEAILQLYPAGDDPPDEPPVPIGMLAEPGDRYIVTDGPAKGMRGYFVWDETGEVGAIHFGGRLALRVREERA
jgi:CubicO group peptidase (beta-lactamase class C family)